MSLILNFLFVYVCVHSSQRSCDPWGRKWCSSLQWLFSWSGYLPLTKPRLQSPVSHSLTTLHTTSIIIPLKWGHLPYPLISTLVYARPWLHAEVYKTTSEMRKTPPLIRILNLSCSNSVWNRWIPLYTNIQLNTILHLLWVCCVCVHSLQLFWHVRSTDRVCCSPGKNVQGRLHKIP